MRRWCKRVIPWIIQLCVRLRDWLRPTTSRYFWRRAATSTPTRRFRAHPKPLWVRHELVRLKALMPDAGCRMIAHHFNRRFAVRRHMTVGKTYVASTLSRHRHLVLETRRKIKRTRPRSIPRNLIWGMDLMVKTDRQGRQHPVVVILDHASRACLMIRALNHKSTRTLVQLINETARRYGKPRYVRTDNDAVFASPWFRWSLLALGIDHQRTDPGCPWQNGRVERAIGTLKGALAHHSISGIKPLAAAIQEVRWWYNHIRPHDHLGGRTPAEVWAGVDVFSNSA